jgi:hypothetical protein
MHPQRSSFFIAAKVLLGAAMMLVCPAMAIAQHHGGHGIGGSTPGGPGRPDGVDEKDALKDFHHALAVQATSQQIAEFQTLVKSAEGAKAELLQFQQQRSKEKSAAESASNTALDQALEKARSETQKFIGGFSDAQKSGLKEITKRLGKADSDLEQEGKKLDQSLLANVAGPETAARAESLDKALTDFSNQQLALGREMGITLATGQDLTFSLPSVKSPVSIANRTVAIGVSGSLSQVAAEGSQRTFKLDVVADLADLQQSITELLRVQLNRSNRCGERVTIQQATLTPSAPATLLAVQMHLERWTCTQMSGQVSANELAESDGSVEIRLTPAVEKPNALRLTSEFGRIEAGGMMVDALRSGDLGDDLRDKVTQSILSALQAGADFKTTLPPVLQNGAVIQSAKFQDAAGTLRVVLEGQVQISSEQADLLASQLNQALSARETPQ